MAQLASASSDITNPANITGTFADIDETTFSDSDYIYSANNTTVTYEFLFSTINDPGTGSGHVVRFRHAQSDDDAGPIAPSSGGSTSTLSAYLYQGGTLIATLASSINANEGSFVEVSYNLTSTEADNITDYTDLRGRLDFIGGGGSPTNRRGAAMSWAQFEAPEYVASTYNESIELSITGSITDSAIAVFDNNDVTLSFDAQVTSSAVLTLDESVNLTLDTQFLTSALVLKLFKAINIGVLKNIKFLK